MMKLSANNMEHIAKLAKAQFTLDGSPGNISVAFSLSGDRGIIVDCHLEFGQQRLALELFMHPDPFAQMGSVDDYSNNVCCTAFTTWLALIEGGGYPAIGFDEEGSSDVIALLPHPNERDLVTLVYCESTHLIVRVLLERENLLNAFRTALKNFQEKYPDPWAAVTELMMADR